MTMENPTLTDLVDEIERESSALKDQAEATHVEAARYTGTTDAHRLTGWARAFELESDRLAAIAAKYQAMTA